jgi:pyruvate ferredoxin oxidoreductase alpha subunit
VPRQVEGSRAVAEAVALCRPEVICAYPISPQTHIVENLSALVKSGELTPCEFVNVESEFAAMSVAIGASATGARAYTATAGQGLLYMTEALYNASGLGLPIVMTVANRAIGAPINIWNDHSDSMSQRDSGWIQLYAETNQEALDLHIQAFRLAETLSTPVMVCMDGFILTHAVERLDIPKQEQVDAFLPPFQPRQVLDPDEPITIGAMVGPEAFMEVKYLAHAKQMRALELIPEIAADFQDAFGRDSGGLIRRYRADDAETIVVALGSVLGTIKDTVDELREQGVRIGVVGITSFRPFPLDAVRAALGHSQRVVVLEKALAVGIGGIVSANVRMALAGITLAGTPHGGGQAGRLHGYTVIAGLGGRPITKASLHGLFMDAVADRLEPLSFLDMDWDVVNRELARMGASRTSGPHAENILRDVGPIAAGPV